MQRRGEEEKAEHCLKTVREKSTVVFLVEVHRHILSELKLKLGD